MGDQKWFLYVNVRDTKKKKKKQTNLKDCVEKMAAIIFIKKLYFSRAKNIK